MEDLIVQINSMRYPSSESSVNLIENLEFSVSEGEIVSIVGPSGAGKTTLLRIIAGLENRYKGEVKLLGIPVTKPSRDIQIVFQDNCLLPWKTVEENIRFAFSRNSLSSEKRDNRIDQWLSAVRLTGKKKRWPKTLSGGEEGRVSFARAFVDSPKVLLMDEPFRNVDLEVRYQLQRELLKALTGKKIITLLVSHSIEDATILSDRVLVFGDSPMSKPVTHEITIPKPREPDDLNVIQYTSKIVKNIMSKAMENDK